MGIALTVAGHIREARAAAGLSRVELAARVGVTARTVTAWEQGTRTPPLEGLVAVAGALGVPAGVLLGDEEPGVAEGVTRLARAEGLPAVLQALARFVSESGCA